MKQRLHRLRRRYDDSLLSTVGVRPAAALRAVFAAGYGLAEVRRDVLAGLVVGVVALPLSMALAIASGVAPQHGLYTAIVAGAVIAVLGGSRMQVSGPTAAFVVLLAPVAREHGLAGLMIASMIAGVVLMGLGLARMGRLIQFIPHPVTTGFTAGIAVVIATLQASDFLGLNAGPLPDAWPEKLTALTRALPNAHPADVAVGVATMAVLLVWPRFTHRVPAPLVALLAATTWVPLLGLEVATVGSRFEGGIPSVPPLPAWPWARPRRRPDRRLAAGALPGRVLHRDARGDRVSALGGGQRRHVGNAHRPRR